MGRDYVEKSDRAYLEKMQEQNHGSFFVPDVNKVLKIDKVRLLEFCNIKQFLEPGKEWCNKSLELIRTGSISLKPPLCKGLKHFT